MNGRLPYSYIEEPRLEVAFITYSKQEVEEEKGICYLGAKDYINVVKVHEDLGLSFHG